MLVTLLDVFYINRFTITTLWYKGLLFVVCMLASVIVFGGLIAFLWYCWEQRMEATQKSESSRQNLRRAPVTHGDTPRRQSACPKRVFCGSRPNLKGTLDNTLLHFMGASLFFHHAAFYEVAELRIGPTCVRKHFPRVRRPVEVPYLRKSPLYTQIVLLVYAEIFRSVSEKWGLVDVGVIVCGPTTLEISVARECRSRNLKRGSDCAIFHFISHTFNL